MELSSVFNFERSNAALSKLEKLLICTKCNEYCSNPRRHSECGNLLCACFSGKSGKCPYCHRQYSQANTSADWHVNNIIEAIKTIKPLINSKESAAATAKDNQFKEVHAKVNNSLGDESSSKSYSAWDKRILSKKDNILNNIPSNLQKREMVDVGAGMKMHTVQVKKNSENETNASKNNQTSLNKEQKYIEFKDVPANVKVIMKRNAKGETKLHTACVKGDIKKVREFLTAGADPCTKDNAGWTPLHEAVSKGHIEIVKLLVEAGAMVNVPGGYNNTPLHDAALSNRLEAAQILIAFGANPDARNIEGYTPRSMVQSKEMENILKEYNPSNVVPRKKCSRQDIILYGFNLPANEVKELNAFVQRYKLRQVSSYSSSVTHIITTTSNRRCVPSVDILHGIMKGKWIIDSQWLHSSLCSNMIPNPCEYEVIGTIKFPDSFAPKRSRENAEKMQPSLFNGCHFYFSGIDKVTVGNIEFKKSQLSSLVISGGGLVLTREPNPEAIPPLECTVPYHAENGSFAKCSHIIVYQSNKHEPVLKYKMPHVKSLPVSWFLDCVETFRLIEP